MFFIDEIRQHGYIALFLIMAVGLFFFPVPNEVLLMSGGFLATTYLLDPVPTFFILYSSVLLHGTLLYFIGRLFSRGGSIQKKKYSHWHVRAEKGKEMLSKYGLKAAGFSYFFPFIRHAVPFSIGISKITYRLFAAVGFSSALVWVSIYYFIGFYYGRTIKDWNTLVEQMIVTLAVLACIIISFQIWKKRKQRLQRRRGYDH
ncbi:DedA family protein [bacterium LRH843]|nr:DedA family protein [bacterium LRH843]